MENVLKALGIRDYEIRRSTYPVFHPGISADFVKDGKTLMSFGDFIRRYWINGVLRKKFTALSSLFLTS